MDYPGTEMKCFAMSPNSPQVSALAPLTVPTAPTPDCTVPTSVPTRRTPSALKLQHSAETSADSADIPGGPYLTKIERTFPRPWERTKCSGTFVGAPRNSALATLSALADTFWTRAVRVMSAALVLVTFAASEVAMPSSLVAAVYERSGEMGKRQRKELDGLVEKRRCTARKKDGTPCKRPPIKGGTVCMSHGGAAPQVRRKANERLLQGVPKMLSELKRLATNESIPPNVRLAAIRDWLDRAGIGETAKAELTVNLPKWEEALGDVFLDMDGEAVPREPLHYEPDEDGVYVPDGADSRWDEMERRKPTGETGKPPPRRAAAPPNGEPDPPAYSRP